MIKLDMSSTLEEIKDAVRAIRPGQLREREETMAEARRAYELDPRNESKLRRYLVVAGRYGR